MSTAHAKAHLSDLVATVAREGDPIVIARRGKPVAALVSIDDAAAIERTPVPERPRGALVLVGAWRDIGDERLDELVGAIYAERDRGQGRRVEIEQ